MLMRNRIILIALLLAIWLAFKAIDELVTGPEVLILLSIAVALMITHSAWLLLAQGRRRSQSQKRIAKDGIPLSQSASAVGGINTLAKTHEYQPFVDIFIAAKNEARVIETTVRNFFKLAYHPFYVWVIDDCSTDNTKEILERLQGEFPNLRLVKRAAGSCPGKSAALNEALALSKGEVVAVFDADAYVAPNFLRLTLPLLEPEGIGAVQAQKKIYEHQSGFLVDSQSCEYALDTYFQTGRDLIGGAVELRGNGQLIKRAALIDVGGWNNKAITDDLDLSMRLLVSNWDTRFCSDAYVYEEGVTTLKALIRQRKRWSEGSIRRYLDYIFPLNSPTRLSFVERIDTLAFTVYFVVPALMLLEVTSECLRFLLGVPTYGKFLALICISVLLITLFNFFVAIKIYRKKTFKDSFIASLKTTIYVYGHWLPVMFSSFCQILFGKRTSTWHPTEHIGLADDLS